MIPSAKTVAQNPRFGSMARSKSLVMSAPVETRNQEITERASLGSMQMSERKLRFRLRRGNFEVELEGDYDYVKGKFEEFLQSPPTMQSTQQTVENPLDIVPGEELVGILEKTPEGKLHFTIPFDRISAKEAIGLILYSVNPSSVEDANLIELLGTSWKAMKDNVVRARVSELRKEGKLIAEEGRYTLSGAGLQWISQEVLPKLKPGNG